MLITWGKKVVDIDSVVEFCAECRRETEHHTCLVYGYWGVFFIFNFCGDKHYYLRCQKCCTECEADAASIERQLPQRPIPALDRFGCLVFIAFCFLFVFGGAYLAWLFKL